MLQQLLSIVPGLVDSSESPDNGSIDEVSSSERSMAQQVASGGMDSGVTMNDDEFFDTVNFPLPISAWENTQ
jgi:hypothetical protein